jgi:signal transduction histidine kinase
MTSIERVPARVLDGAIAAAITAGMLVDTVLGAHDGPWWANLLCSLAIGLSLLWRRVLPLLPLAVFLVAGVVMGLWLTGYDEAFTPLLALVVIGYSVGRWSEGRMLAIGAAMGLAGIVAVELALTESFGDWLFPGLVMFAAGGIGVTIRNRIELARTLAARAEELEASREAREQEAVQAERRRLARELHDVVAHTVSVMVVQAGGARRTLHRDPDAALEALAAVEATGRGALVELRRLLGLLRPEGESAPHAPQPGMAAVNDLVARARAAGLPVELNVEGEPGSLPAGVDLAAYRVVQEALTNTLQHAGPARARVTIRWESENLVLVVDDSGQGPVNAGDGTGQGLVGMRERVAMCGGELETGRRRGGGFHVEARLPREAREAAA